MIQNDKNNRTYFVYVLDRTGQPLMPTTRYGKVRRLLKAKKAVVVDTKPFTIRLKYEPETHFTQETILGIDPGRTNIGISVIRRSGQELFSAVCETRNREIPKLMQERATHRRASRRGERLARKRLAKRYGTLTSFPEGRLLPGYEKPVMVRDIINTESRFHNRKRNAGWLTPTATQLLRTHVNLVRKIKKIFPVTDAALELNRFAFLQMENPHIRRWEYQRGPLYGRGSVEEAVYEQQDGICLLCKKRMIEHYHHTVPKSKGGSETLKNRVGLCNICHEQVHKDPEWADKLASKKAGLNKKYGALSVLNQVIPFLLDELDGIFPDSVAVTEGRSTKAFREDHGIVKDHDRDAYCIACSSLREPIRCSFSTGYRILQFRRHDRARIKAQTERTYRLGKTIVARNRRKRMDQKEDSLHEWYLKMKSQLGIAQAKTLQQTLTVQKSIRRYNRIERLMPGTVFFRNGTRLVLSGQLTGGNYLRAVGDGKTNHPTRFCRIAKENTGLVFL
ncbi:MAG: RRXRR domain-containing protein [Lachnospiraceae bacterium]